MSKSVEIKSYARALMDLISADEDQLPVCLEVMHEVVEKWQTCRDLSAFLTDPLHLERLKLATLKRIFPDICTSSLLANTIDLISEHRNLSSLNTFARHFIELASLKSGELEVKLSCANEPSQREKAEAQFQIEKLLEARVKLHFEVNSKLLAGYILQTQNFIFDYSLSGQINRMRRHLLS